MHQRYSMICHLTNLLCNQWLGISIMFMIQEMKVLLGGTKNVLLNLRTAKHKTGYNSQVFSAIFPFSKQRRTRIIREDVLCGRGQKQCRLGRRKWKEVTGSYQFSLKNWQNVEWKKGHLWLLMSFTFIFMLHVCTVALNKYITMTAPHFPSSRSIYQKFREVDLLDKKKTVTALKPGEDRAILLGLGMIFSSVMMYFVLGITILRSYADRYRPVFFFTPYKGVKWYFCQKHVLFIRCVCWETALVPSQPENCKNEYFMK